MRYISTFTLLLLSLALAIPGFAAEEAIECETCGMDWNISSTRLTASLAVDGKTAQHHYESLGCLFDALAEYGDDAELKSVQVLDFATYDSDAEAFVDAEQASFLFDTDPLPGSMGPFVAAFASEAAAKKARPELGGKVLDFAEVREGILSGEASSAGECNCPACQAARESEGE